MSTPRPANAVCECCGEALSSTYLAKDKRGDEYQRCPVCVEELLGAGRQRRCDGMTLSAEDRGGQVEVGTQKQKGAAIDRVGQR